LPSQSTLSSREAVDVEFKRKPDSKMVEIWLTRAESNDAVIQARLKPLYKKYKAQGYTVAVFQSGSQDLASVTSNLLCYNRQQMI